MRKNLVIGVAAAAALAFSISACGGSATPTVTVTKEAAPAPAPAPAPQPEPETGSDTSGYLSYIRSEDTTFLVVEDSTAVETGTAVCLALAGGSPLEDIVMAGINAGLTSNQTATIIVGAVMFLCPQYKDEVQRQIES
jgi:hypothetical protein